MKATNEYGRALFLISEELGKTDSTLRDIEVVAQLLENNPDYIKILDTPAITKEEKLRLCDEAFSSFDEHLLSLIKILCEKHSVYTFHEVKNTFVSLYNECYGIEEVEAVTAIKMSDTQLLKMKEKLEAETGKTIVIKNTVSPEILGGVKLRYSGKQLDNSVRTRLDKFEAALKNTVI